jgi:UDP-glucose 4-epimerase
MRLLVLGGDGFIGSHLVDALVRSGHSVRSFDRPGIARRPGEEGSSQDLERIEGEFTAEGDIARAVKGCDIVFHLVSTTLPSTSNLDPAFDVESNVIGSLRLLDHALSSGAKRVIFVSSGGTVYGIPTLVPIPEDHPTNPICSYGITKLTIEKYLNLYRHLHGLDSVVLRIANPYGERQRTQASQGAIAVFLGKVLGGEPIDIWGDGSAVRDYIHISDVVRALLMAIDYTGSHRTFNIGSGCGASVNEVIAAIEAATGITPVRRYFDARPFDVPRSVLSIERARNSLDWQPTVPLADGIASTANWLRRSGEV